MLRVITVAFVLVAVAAAHPSRHSAQTPQRPLRIIAFGAHPDDAELKASGVAALWAAAGHKVKFVAMTNGDIGHFESAGGPLALRRKAEVAECARILGIENEVLDIHDGELDAVAREPADGRTAHPRMAGRHRHGAPAVRLSPGSPLHRCPHGRRGGGRRRAVLRARHASRLRAIRCSCTTRTTSRIRSRSTPSVVVGIDAAAEKKWQCVSAMPSQFGDKDSWQGRTLPDVPAGDRERQAYLLDIVKKRDRAVADLYRQRLIALYGAERGKAIEYAEAFQLGQYGRQPSPDELKALFPMP